MATPSLNRTLRLLAAVLIGGALGAGAGLSIRQITQQTAGATKGADADPDAGDQGVQPVVEAVAGPALAYARAVQNSNWEAVIERTLWMQERLERAAARADDPDAAREAARKELIQRLEDRTLSENQLLGEGVEDKYVFAPGAALEPVGQDSGREDLARPVDSRTWIRVTYPSRRRALRDPANIPIRALTAGVNLTAEGLVLKANVIGNLDIAWDTLTYDWERGRAPDTAAP